MLGSLVPGVVLMAGFLGWERRARYPMLPLGYFRRRAFSTANAVVFFQFGSLFIITQLFQIGLGYSPLAAGLRILVWMATPMPVTPVAGALADRICNRPFMLAGLILQASGLGWLAASTHPGVSYVAAVLAPAKRQLSLSAPPTAGIPEPAVSRVRSEAQAAEQRGHGRPAGSPAVTLPATAPLQALGRP